MSTWESLAKASGNRNDSKEADISSRIGLSTAKAGFSMVRVIIDYLLSSRESKGTPKVCAILLIIVSTLFAIRLSFATRLASRHNEFAWLHVTS